VIGVVDRAEGNPMMDAMMYALGGLAALE